MGTVNAPSYANLFMAQVKEKHIYHMSLLYLRYINDMFITCKDTKEQLIRFINELNKNIKLLNLNMKFHCRKSTLY